MHRNAQRFRRAFKTSHEFAAAQPMIVRI